MGDDDDGFVGGFSTKPSMVYLYKEYIPLSRPLDILRR